MDNEECHGWWQGCVTQKTFCAMQGDKDDGNDEKDNEGLQWVPGRIDEEQWEGWQGAIKDISSVAIAAILAIKFVLSITRLEVWKEEPSLWRSCRSHYLLVKLRGEKPTVLLLCIETQSMHTMKEGHCYFWFARIAIPSLHHVYKKHQYYKEAEQWSARNKHKQCNPLWERKKIVIHWCSRATFNLEISS